MRGRGSAGCMGFSLIGLLVSVVLVVWLGSKVMDGTDLTAARDSDGSGSATSTPPATTIPEGVTITASPSTGLGDGSEIVVASDAFPAGTSVEVTICASRTNIVTRGQDPCDPARVAAAVVGADGKLSTPFTVGRTITVGTLPLDCGREPGYCSVRVRSTTDPTLGGSVPLTFGEAAPGNPDERPPITLPD